MGSGSFAVNIQHVASARGLLSRESREKSGQSGGGAEKDGEIMNRQQEQAARVATGADALAAAREFLAANGNHEISTELGVFAFEQPLVLTPQQVQFLGLCLTRFDARKQEHEAFIAQGLQGQDRHTLYWHGSQEYMNLLWRHAETLPPGDEPSDAADAFTEWPEQIKQTQMLAAVRFLQKANGNKELRQEIIPWNRSLTRRVLVYADPIDFTAEQLRKIRWFFVPPRPQRNKPQHFQILDATLRPVIVTWAEDTDYQHAIHWKTNDEAWEKTKAENADRRAKAVLAAKASGKVEPQPPAIRLEGEIFEKFPRLEKKQLLEKVFEVSGVRIIHDQNQPTGERFIIVNRQVEIPNAWAEFLANDDNSFESFGYRSLGGLTVDWNRYAVADEEMYYFYMS